MTDLEPSRGQQRLYPRWWHHQRHHLVALRNCLLRLLARHIHLQSGQVVVDLGCGDRPYEPLFHDRGCRYIGCDLGALADVRLQPGLPVGLPDESADGVVSFQVLEHVWELDWYLGECRRLLKPGGWLLLSTHGAWLYHPHPADYRRWTRDGLLRELTERGLAAEVIDGLVGPLAWTTQFRLLGLRHALLRVPVLGPILVPPVALWMNLRMLLEDAVTPATIREANACVYVTLSRKPALGRPPR